MVNIFIFEFKIIHDLVSSVFKVLSVLLILMKAFTRGVWVNSFFFRGVILIKKIGVIIFYLVVDSGVFLFKISGRFRLEIGVKRVGYFLEVEWRSGIFIIKLIVVFLEFFFFRVKLIIFLL